MIPAIVFAAVLVLAFVCLVFVSPEKAARARMFFDAAVLLTLVAILLGAVAGR